MRKYFLILLIFPLLSSSQIINFSDINLKTKLLQASVNSSIAYDVNYNQIKIDVNSNNEIEINEALLVYALNISNSNINNLNGLESFNNMIDLNCSTNNITSFNFNLFPNLIYFKGNDNLITSLSINNHNTIDTILLANNNLTSTVVSNCSNLWELNCSNNNLTSINIANLPTLFNLNLNNNQLANVNLSNFQNLNYVYFNNNVLTTLTFNNCPNILIVNCSNNLLTQLNFSNLTLLNSIYCFDNQLNTINISGCTSLKNLFSANNNLVSIDASTCSSLDILDCQNNQLTNINVKNNSNETSYGICGNPNLNNVCIDNNLEEINQMTSQVSICGYPNVLINPNCTLSVNSVNMTLTFEIFPNPTQDILNINTNSHNSIKSVKIYNTVGQLVFTKISYIEENMVELDIASLNPGVYLALIDSEQGVLIEKIIKN